MGKLENFFYKFYFNQYLKKHPNQIKDIKDKQLESRTFLVISNTAFGDTLLSTPAIKSLKHSFPNGKVIALLNKSIIPLFKEYPYIDEIVPFYGGFKKFKVTVNRLRKYSPDTALIFHGNGPQDIYFSVLSGCEFILKHPNSSPLKKYLSYDFRKKEQHTIEDRLDLVRLIGGTSIDTNMNLRVFNHKNLLDKYKEFKGYIGFQIGAADIYKMWPIENFIILAKQLLEEYNCKIVITGISSEYELAQKIVKSCEENVINMCGKCSIEELPYLIQNFKLLITNDTGTMHLAIALKTPTISLFSPTSAKNIGPYQNQSIHQVIQKDGRYIQKLPKKQRSDEAMKLINVEEVLSSVKKVIN